MRLISIASLALFGVAKFANAQEVEEAGARNMNYYSHPPHKPVQKPVQGVRATFTTAISGAKGTVSITDSTDVAAEIEITDFDKIAEVQSWPTCSSGGLIWSIQANWPEENTDEMFGTDCEDVDDDDVTILGGRYDPSFACSPVSQYFTNDLCDLTPNQALTNDSEYLEEQGYDLFPAHKSPCTEPIEDEYNCWPCLYKQYPFACDVGDFTGKYGTLLFRDACPATAEAAEAASAVAAEAVAEADEGTDEAAVVDEAAAYHHNQYNCRSTTHVHFKTHDRFMDKPSLYRARAIRLSCNDGTQAGIPLMCAKLVPFVETIKPKGKYY